MIKRKLLNFNNIVFKSLIIILCSGFSVQAQEHSNQRKEQVHLLKAKQHFAEGQYQMTLEALNSLPTDHLQTQKISSDDLVEMEFMRQVAQLKLGTTGAINSAIQFYNTNSILSYRHRIAFYIGQYFFKRDQLKKAIPFYEAADINNLNNVEITDLKFELAYAYFNNQDFEKSAQLFAYIKEVKGKYKSAGNYYYGLLAYNKGQFDEALNSFQLVVNEPQYKKVVPYYIAEIQYFKGEKQTALNQSLKLIQADEKSYYDKELHLLAAQIFFEDKSYKEAIPFFEYYYDNTDKIRKEELYEMAYSYYKINEWGKAIEKFKLLGAQQDSLGQTAMYLLGDCYLKINDKKSARNAFGICSEMKFDPNQREAALLLYGKLCYEMGNNDIAKNSFHTLQTEFPRSSYSAEAKTLVGEILLKLNNYEEAFSSLKDIKEKSPAYWAVWQKATYGYAMKELKQSNTYFADSLLTLSLIQPVDKAYEAAACFWKADIAFDAKRNELAVVYLKRFIAKAQGIEKKVTQISKQATLANGYLNLGYASMELENYKDAQQYFGQTKQNAGEENSALLLNASIREADAAFMQKNYKDALLLYQKLINADGVESDYARIQKAIIFGLQGKMNDKISLLQQVINKYNSPYDFEARYELANTYIENDKFVQAIGLLEPLTMSKDARSIAPKALTKVGFAHRQLNNFDEAILAYKRILADYPNSDERSSALEALRNIYIERNQPEAYSVLIRDYNLPISGANTFDSTYYSAAEAQISSGKWSEAKTALVLYLAKFPNGVFVPKAQYYKAESHYQLKEFDEALEAFSDVVKLPWNEFTEVSAKRAGEISFKKNDFNEALRYFGILRNSAMSQEQLIQAYSGMMHASLGMNNSEQTLAYADTLLSFKDLSTNMIGEAQFVKARMLEQQNKLNEAIEIYKNIHDIESDASLAEARFRLAQIYFKQGKLKEAEAEAARATQLSNGNNYWVDRAWLLIVDILVKQKDYFNAKATLQSIIKNAKNAEFKKDAQQKLEQVKKSEKQQSKLKDE